MKTVILEVRDPADAMAEFAQAWKTGKATHADRISFASPELLWKVLTAKRWDLLKALCGAGPLTVREAARRVSRDVKAVHSDLSALLSAGVLVRTEAGRVEWHGATAGGALGHGNVLRGRLNASLSPFISRARAPRRPRHRPESGS
jgi:predicted transcriptional regulator